MTTVRPRREFFFLHGLAGRLCAIYYHPLKTRLDRRNVLHVPAFAEEMNKSRRMVALQADALARTGIGVLVLDLYGTGDSEGDFSQARWDIWLDDLGVAARWLTENGGEVLTLWGLRLGCLLAIEYVQRYPRNVDSLIYWQPVTQGRTMLTQFLRLRVAAAILGQSGGDSVASLQAKLEAGESIETAGYELTPQLANAIAARTIAAPCGPPVHWLELVPSAERHLSPGSRKTLDELNKKAVSVYPHTVVGDPFWSTQECTVVPSLLEKTTAVLLGSSVTDTHRPG